MLPPFIARAVALRFYASRQTKRAINYRISIINGSWLTGSWLYAIFTSMSCLHALHRNGMCCILVSVRSGKRAFPQYGQQYHAFPLISFIMRCPPQHTTYISRRFHLLSLHQTALLQAPCPSRPPELLEPRSILHTGFLAQTEGKCIYPPTSPDTSFSAFPELLSQSSRQRLKQHTRCLPRILMYSCRSDIRLTCCYL